VRAEVRDGNRHVIVDGTLRKGRVSQTARALLEFETAEKY